MQVISEDTIVRSVTVRDLKDFYLQFLATQYKKREQLVSVMPAIIKALDLMGGDVAELSTENENLKKIGSYDEKWLLESETKLLKQIDDEERKINQV